MKSLEKYKIEANKEFFKKIIKITHRTYIWPDKGLEYTIENNKLVCMTPYHKQSIENITDKKFVKDYLIIRYR